MSPSSTWFATGRDFADALVVGPAVAKDGGTLLLIDGENVVVTDPAYVWLDDFREDIASVTLLGGPAAITDGGRQAVQNRLLTR